MRLPLTVRWTTGAAVGETSTESRDVSSRGVYFFLSKDVKEGSPVEILLTLPNEITMAGPVRVRCLGRVQRTEPRDEGAIGVVAAIERYEFLRGNEDKRGQPKTRWQSNTKSDADLEADRAALSRLAGLAVRLPLGGLVLWVRRFPQPFWETIGVSLAAKS